MCNKRDCGEERGLKLDTAEFARREHIAWQMIRVDRNPFRTSCKEGPLKHWLVILFHGGKHFATYFSCGEHIPHTSSDAKCPYHKNGKHCRCEPPMASVLDRAACDCMAIDATRSFEEWAEYSGFDPDSRSAEKCHCVCLEQAGKVRKWLGDDLYAELLWKTERL